MTSEVCVCVCVCSQFVSLHVYPLTVASYVEAAVSLTGLETPNRFLPLKLTNASQENVELAAVLHTSEAYFIIRVNTSSLN